MIEHIILLYCVSIILSAVICFTKNKIENNGDMIIENKPLIYIKVILWPIHIVILLVLILSDLLSELIYILIKAIQKNRRPRAKDEK